MATQHLPDRNLVLVAGTMILLGIVILASVSASFSLERTGNTFYFLQHQILFGLLPGLILGAIAYAFPLEKLKRLSLVFLTGNLVLLLFVFLPFFGAEVRGSYRWIYLGPFSFQPSELLKITFILYLAAWMSSKKERILLPFIFILGIISLFLIMQPDISTLGIIGLTGIFMYFVAGTPLLHALFIVTGGLGILALLALVAPYRASRIAVFFDPTLDPLGKGYQLKQALIGIGSGGLTGVGLGLSVQKFGVLPEPISDSIFAIFAEETGFIGVIILLLMFLLFAWQGSKVANNARDTFSKLAAMGIVSWITLQALLNIASMTGLLPIAGIPLPFISYGGSALVTELIGLGILLNISRRTSL